MSFLGGNFTEALLKCTINKLYIFKAQNLDIFDININSKKKNKNKNTWL